MFEEKLELMENHRRELEVAECLSNDVKMSMFEVICLNSSNLSPCRFCRGDYFLCCWQEMRKTNSEGGQDSCGVFGLSSLNCSSCSS